MTDTNLVPTEVTTWSLEMLDPADLRPASRPDRDLLLIRSEIPSPELARFLYTAVGGDWYWYDQLDWTYERWQNVLERPGMEIWMLLERGTPAGHFVLKGDGEGTVEILYFGLLPTFIGQGLGGYLLTEAIRASWSLGERWEEFTATTRVWVHTCSLDGQPAALNNYKSRGFKLFKTTTAIEHITPDPPGPWPGAR